MAELGKPASLRAQPALQHCWPKTSVTSPVKQGLEQRGSWGLKCLFLADRRLCWISTVHAPNGNLSLSLSSLSGVCLDGLFSSKKVSLPLRVPWEFLLCFSFSSFSLSSPHRYKQESFGGNHRVLGKRNPYKAVGPAPVRPMGHLCRAFGVVGEVGSTCFLCPVVEEVKQSKVQLASLLCCRAKKLSTRKKYEKVPWIKLDPFPTATAPMGHNRNLTFVGMENWARCNEKIHCIPFLCSSR